MNELLRDQFEALGVKFEEGQWDANKKDWASPKSAVTSGRHRRANPLPLGLCV
jgi:hypothetical protein